MRIDVALAVSAIALSPGLGATSNRPGELVELEEALQVCRERLECDRFEKAFDDCIEHNRGCGTLHRVMGYPQRAIDECVEGMVQLEVVIGDDGRVVKATVLNAEPEGYFEEAAISSVNKWKHKSGSTPSRSTFEMGVEFSLFMPCEPKQMSPNNALERPDEN